MAIEQNAQWYRDFCAAYKNRRKRYAKPRTIIKRCDTKRALERIACGNVNGVYAERLLPVVEQRAARVKRKTKEPDFRRLEF